jgi:phospholipid/cholesterol/gamma-HCH transport system permease protein
MSGNESLKIAYPSHDTVVLSFLGDWILSRQVYSWRLLQSKLVAREDLRAIRIDPRGLGQWDSRLLCVLQQLHDFCEDRSLIFETSALPDSIRGLLDLGQAVSQHKGAHHQTPLQWGLSYRIGVMVLDAWRESLRFTHFAGELVIALFRLLVGKGYLRRTDFFHFLQSSGPQALPIVSLIAVLIGAVLAFVGAIQLQMFGAEIYAANLVALGSVREMGAMMTAIIMAGRTGSAYAAQLGTMQVNDELDALKTFGIPIIDFLVLPRTLALVIMMPLLTIWANTLGILGGLLVGIWVLDISLLEYLIQTRSSLDFGDLMVGLVKSVLFGIVIAMSGCLRGLQSGRDSSSVGQATTSATVTAILLIVIWDAITTILFNLLGI